MPIKSIKNIFFINKMSKMSEVAKETFKKTINKLFSQRFEDMKEEKDYIELLKICKY